MKSRRSRRTPHPQIHLPPLDAAYALSLVELFERAIAAIWRAHGDRMAALLDRRAAASPTADGPEAVDDRDEADDDEVDLLPF